MPKTSRFNQVRAQCPLPTRWLWFYTRVVLIVNMLIIGYSLTLYVPQLLLVMRSVNFSIEYKLYSVLANVYSAASLWLCINAYYGIAHFTESGYLFNNAFLWVLFCGNALLMLIDSGATLLMIAGSILAYGLFLVPNLIYFKKRRDLFGLLTVDPGIPVTVDPDIPS